MAGTSERHWMNWSEVVDAMGGRIVRSTETEARVLLERNGQFHTLILTDNGGEVNVSKIVPAHDGSIAANCGPFTLADRILTALDGEPIDYAHDLDGE